MARMEKLVLGVVIALGGAAAVARASDKTPAEEANDIFLQRCNVCHGDKGDGNGPASAALNPRPRNWTDAKWQASVDDAKIAKVVVEGGPAVGLNVLMAPNPDLKGKDAVVKEIVKRIRSYKGKK